MAKGNIDFLKSNTIQMKLSEMKIPGYNPRKDIRENPVKYEQLHDSIKTIGYSQYITVNKRNGHIVGGNQRYKVICDMVQDAGWKLDEVELEVISVDMTDAVEMAANSAYNNMGMENEDEKLAAMFEAIKEIDNNLLKVTGFEQTAIDKLIDDINGVPTEKEEKKNDSKAMSAVFDITLKMPHQYFEIYQDYRKANGEDELIQAIIQKIMNFGGK